MESGRGAMGGRDTLGFAVLYFTLLWPERDEGGIPVGAKSPRQGCGRAAAEALTAWVSKHLRRRRPLPLPASGVLALLLILIASLRRSSRASSSHIPPPWGSR